MKIIFGCNKCHGTDWEILGESSHILKNGARYTFFEIKCENCGSVEKNVNIMTDNIDVILGALQEIGHFEKGKLIKDGMVFSPMGVI